MRQLHSPHVLEVYRYDETRHEYYAEYADETLLKYISHNPNLDIKAFVISCSDAYPMFTARAIYIEI